MLAATAFAVAAAVVVVLLDRGGSAPTRPSAPNGAFASPETIADMRLGGAARLSRPVPRAPWLVSFDLHFVPGGRVVINPGSVHDRIIITGGATPSASWRGRSYVLRKSAGWGSPDWRHFELRGGARGARITIDGQALPAGRLVGRRFEVSAPTGSARLAAVLISSSSDRASLPLHRLAELHARLPAGAGVPDADRQDEPHVVGLSGGYWAGALWQAAALDRSGGLFAGWSRQATAALLARAQSPSGTAGGTAGLVAAQAMLSAWRALCRGRPAPAPECTRLSRGALATAARLQTLAATNPGAGTIPTNAATPVADTDIGSMLALPVLTWAARIAHRPQYARLALHHAQVVAALLVRSDGSTADVVRFDRATGRIRFLGAGQGLRSDTTWSQGEGEALYGFAQAASELRNPGLLAVAEQIAGYVAKTLPPSGIPARDDSAPAGAGPDLTAAAVTAAGMFRLGAACRRMSSACSNAGQYAALGSRMLSAILAAERTRPPLGEAGGGQSLDAMGLSYTLEALNLERRLPQ